MAVAKTLPIRVMVITFSLLLVRKVITAVSSDDPFDFFEPTATFTTAERSQLDSDQPIVHVLPSRGSEVAIYAAVPISVDGDRLVAWVRQIEAFKKSAYVPAIRRFSTPPRIEDLSDLVLDDGDLSEILQCQPSHCGLKLSVSEMTSLQRAAAEGEGDQKTRLQEQFRQIVFDRIEAYLAGGKVGPYEDHSGQVWPAEEFARLVDHSAFLIGHAPTFAAYLRGVHTTPARDVESFLYWSKERVANRPIISVTDVEILRGQSDEVPDALVAGKELFSTHYVNASFGLTALVRGEPGGCNYLVYVNRSEVDVMHGMFGGVIRGLIQRRVRTEATDVLRGLRQRLESGDPPGVEINSQ